MNKQQRENIGLNTPFIIFATIIIVALIGFFIFPGNAIHQAPLINKLGAGLVAGLAVYYGIGWSKDIWWNKIESERVYFILNLIVFAGLLVLALLILTVFHSGPLGTSTNPL